MGTNRPSAPDGFVWYSQKNNEEAQRQQAAGSAKREGGSALGAVVGAVLSIVAIGLLFQVVRAVPLDDRALHATAVVEATRVALEARTAAPLDDTSSAVTKTEALVRLAATRVVRVKVGNREGSAFLYRRRGAEALFVTSAHLVAGTTAVDVVTRDAGDHRGTVVTRDVTHDLAVVSVVGLPTVPPLLVGNSDALKVGDELYVIGVPPGDALVKGPSFTRGTLSGRRVVDDVPYIQTDAAMTPASIGGPVVNASGQVVGVATWGLNDRLVPGSNYAIPSSIVQRDVDRLLDTTGGGSASDRADSWARLTAEKASPRARSVFDAVWTGREVILWGGMTDQGPTNTGGAYNPSTGAWRALPASGAPSARVAPRLFWTEKDVLVWGGAKTLLGESYLNDGARYNPAANAWAPLPKSPLSPRIPDAAVWTGREMIVWGGTGGNRDRPDVFGDGARYNPTTNTWTTNSALHAPSPRWGSAVVWTGQEMIVWGGHGPAGKVNELGDGARYNPTSNTWRPMASAGAPSPRREAAAVWTGKEMIVWGGQSGLKTFGDGARYDPATDTWKPMSTDDAPGPRANAAGVWTGRLAIIWGGAGPSMEPFGDGASYDPEKNAWIPLTPSPIDSRTGFAGVWAGDRLIVWGGFRPTSSANRAAYTFYDDGAIYRPGGGKE